MEFLCSYNEATSNSAEQRAKTRHLQKYASCPLSGILVAFSAKCPLTQMRLFIALLLYLARSDQPIVAAHWPGLIIVLTSRMPSTPGTVYLQSAAVGRRYTSLALLFMAGRELPKPGLQSPRVEQWSSGAAPNSIFGIVQDSSSPVGAIHYPLYTVMFSVPYTNHIFRIP